MRSQAFPDPQTFKIIGAAMAVHTELGCGFLEKVYKAALPIELAERGVAFSREVEIPVYYRGRELFLEYKADFVCCNDIIVEVKAIAQITDRDIAQLINYLKATRFKRGLLLNFGAVSLQHKRIVN